MKTESEVEEQLVECINKIRGKGKMTAVLGYWTPKDLYIVFNTLRWTLGWELPSARAEDIVPFFRGIGKSDVWILQKFPGKSIEALVVKKTHTKQTKISKRQKEIMRTIFEYGKPEIHIKDLLDKLSDNITHGFENTVYNALDSLEVRGLILSGRVSHYRKTVSLSEDGLAYVIRDEP